MSNLDKIKQNIRDGKLDLAIQRLLDFGSNGDFIKKVAIVSSRYSYLEEIFQNGEIEFEKKFVERNRITLALLDLIEYLEEEIYYDKDIPDCLSLLDLTAIQGVEEIRRFRASWFKNIQSGTDDGYSILDLKFLNRGTAPAFLHRIEIEAERLRIVPHSSMLSAYPLSWEYNAMLDTNLSLQRVGVNISQVVRHNEVDRFSLIIAHERANLDFAEFEIKLVVYFNESSKIITPKIPLRIKGPLNPRIDLPSKVSRIDGNK